MVLAKLKNDLVVSLSFLRYQLFYRKPDTFSFNGTTYRYFLHSYNATWRGERAVEIPISLGIYTKFKGKRILEVGNVLSHYIAPTNHTVVDKYEQAPRVLNSDVIDYHPDSKFDLILSISTLEHVGFDESIVDHAKFNQSIRHLLTLLAPGGSVLITLPVGYNPHVDLYLQSPDPFCDNIYFMKRRTRSNKWVQCTWEMIQNSQYDSPYAMANGLAICIYQNR